MRREMKRKVVHLGNGFWAFILAFINRPIAILVVLVALSLVLFVFRPKAWTAAFEAMARESDHQKGFLMGPFIYIICVLFLVFFFDLRVAAASFAILAFGDGLATVVGVNFGTHTYENGKSYEGTVTYVIAGFLLSFFAFSFVQTFNSDPSGWILLEFLIIPLNIDLLLVAGILLVVCAVCGLLEARIPDLLGIDDNILSSIIPAVSITFLLLL